MHLTLQKGAIIIVGIIAFEAVALFYFFPREAPQKVVQQPNEDLVQQEPGHESQPPIQNPRLLPSIEILPPKNIVVVDTGEAVYLRFGVTYANKGLGALELVSFLEESAGDQQLPVSQRVYLQNGTIEDNPVGFFFWHDAHGHFHFTDFMEYMLRPADNPAGPVFKEKITYCLRDKEFTYPALLGAPQEKVYLECGPEKQGISPGWSDTYEYTFPDQNITITNISSGFYELVITFDPLGRLQEIDREDNVQTTLLFIDRKTNSVEIREGEN